MASEDDTACDEPEVVFKPTRYLVAEVTDLANLRARWYCVSIDKHG